MTLETPLRGRFLRERYLVFAPPDPYLGLVGIVAFAGLVLIFWGVIGGAEYWLFVGAMLLVAGTWAALSLNWLAFDLREKSYRRRDGAGLVRGSFAELEALFVLAENRPSVGSAMTMGHVVTYRIVLQWLGLRLPSMVLEQDHRSLGLGLALGAAAVPTLTRAEQFGRSLGLPVVDHTHVSVSKPV